MTAQTLIIQSEHVEPRKTQTAARALATTADQSPLSETAALLAVIERAARDPSVDLDKMERLFAMHERVLERSAREAFARAFSEMVPHLPVINRTGGITVYSRDARDHAAKNNGEYPPGARPIQNTPYATMDDILEGVNPILAAHGFSIRFEYETVPTGDSFRVRTRGILLHREGHSEKAETPPLLQDSSGSKNGVQGVGSSMTYGRRYALRALLPIVSHAPQDRDDDGRAAGSGSTITAEQEETLRREIMDTDASLPKFLSGFGIETLADLPAKRFQEAMNVFADRRALKAKGAANAR